MSKDTAMRLAAHVRENIDCGRFAQHPIIMEDDHLARLERFARRDYPGDYWAELTQ